MRVCKQKVQIGLFHWRRRDTKGAIKSMKLLCFFHQEGRWNCVSPCLIVCFKLTFPWKTPTSIHISEEMYGLIEPKDDAYHHHCNIVMLSYFCYMKDVMKDVVCNQGHPQTSNRTDRILGKYCDWKQVIISVNSGMTSGERLHLRCL